MKRTSAIAILSTLSLVLPITSAALFADATENSGYQEESSKQQSSKEQAAPFVSFTGKITKNKVRLRQQPNLDSPIVREFSQGDMVIVDGEAEDFYAVHPPANAKAYIFRTFVLDNMIEGSRVNVRLEPDTDSPVVAQLNAGTRVEGSVSSLNNKWLEISMPESARFYISKDYVEKMGDHTLMALIEKRKEEVNRLLHSTYMISQSELQKPFPEIHLEGVYENFNKLIHQYSDFSEQSARARELLTLTQDTYLQKKIAYLETRAKNVHEEWISKNAQMSDQVKTQQQRLSQLEEQLEKEKAAKAANRAWMAQNSKPEKAKDAYGNLVNSKMLVWAPQEQLIYQQWSNQNDNRSEDEFYHEQRQQSVTLQGIVEPYVRAINNKPGDYILINRASHLPIAYLYSTQIDLQDSVGHEVSLQAAPRPNNNFAFPAYYVLGIE